MKTSNKLLLGLFVFIVLGMIIANLYLKNEIEKNPQMIETIMKSQIKTQHGVTIHIDTVSADSIAMDEAIGNE